MRKSPISSRIYVGIFGNTNTGKSSLFNSLISQDLAIVSSKPGTTADPIIKGMELSPFGPIALVDTAGLDDIGDIGSRRTRKSRDMLNRVDIAIYTADINIFDKKGYAQMVSKFSEKNIPYILVFTKTDISSKSTILNTQKEYPDSVLLSTNNQKSIDNLKNAIGLKLKQLDVQNENIIADLVPINSTIVMVTPIDSGAPKGRLILPQVQVLRECLDYNLTCHVTQDTELESVLSNLKKVDLVVTDSKVFNIVSHIVPKDIPLTSFSILFARHKGDLATLLAGTAKIDNLEDNANILMAEGCTHGDTHEDIGRVKIPNLLTKHTKKDLNFKVYSGYDFPDNLKDYDLVIHCGGCMLNRKEITTRLWKCEDLKIPVTNYGMVLAHVNGILKRSMEIFSLNNKDSQSE